MCLGESEYTRPALHKGHFWKVSSTAFMDNFNPGFTCEAVVGSDKTLRGRKFSCRDSEVLIDHVLSFNRIISESTFFKFKP